MGMGASATAHLPGTTQGATGGTPGVEECKNDARQRRWEVGAAGRGVSTPARSRTWICSLGGSHESLSPPGQRRRGCEDAKPVRLTAYSRTIDWGFWFAQP